MLLAVSHRCFGEFLPFLDLINSCSLSNFHFYYICQNKYGEEMVRCHGEGFNWWEADIDPMAVYASGGGKSHGRWVTDRFHSNPMSLQCYDIFLCNTCCTYSMLNGVVDSRHVRAKKVAMLSQSTGAGSSFFSHQSEIEQLKETLRQRDEEQRQRDEMQRA
jgi:hypothetical protein